MNFSARKFLVVATISTYCLCVVGALILTLIKAISVEVFLALFAGVGTLAMYITKAYFDDKVRPEDVKEAK